jgi:cytochrome c5
MASPLVLLFAALQVSAATPAASPQPTAVAAPMTSASDAAADAPQDPMVCRRVDVSGSPFAKKECHHLSTWNRMAHSGEM